MQVRACRPLLLSSSPLLPVSSSPPLPVSSSSHLLLCPSPDLLLLSSSALSPLHADPWAASAALPKRGAAAAAAGGAGASRIHISPSKPVMSERELREKLRPIFDKFDEDGSGAVSTAEMTKIVKQLKLQASDAHTPSRPHTLTHRTTRTAHRPFTSYLLLASCFLLPTFYR